MAAVLASAASGVSWFLVRYASVVVMLYLLSTVSARAGFAARVLAAWMSLVLCALYGVLASVVLRLLGSDRWQSAQWATARAFKYTMASATGITFVVDDPRHILDTTRPAVFVGNHQSALDVLMLGCMFPKHCSVTAKRQLRNYPFLGWFMRLSGTIFIDRASSKDAREAMRGAADAIRAHRQSVYMFPEGTRSHSAEPTLLPFKKGAFHLAVQAGVPIVPVVVANYSHLYNTSQYRFLPGRIPIKDLTNRVRETMLKELLVLTEQARASTKHKAAPIHADPTPAASGVSSGVSL